MKGKKINQVTCKISISSKEYNQCHKNIQNKSKRKHLIKQKSPVKKIQVRYQQIMSNRSEKIKDKKQRSNNNIKKKQIEKNRKKQNSKQQDNNNLIKNKKLSILDLKENDYYKSVNGQVSSKNKNLVDQQIKKKKLRQMIELGKQSQKIMIKMYNIKIRSNNKLLRSRSLINLDERIDWGVNQKKLKEYALSTIRKICHSMRSIRNRYGQEYLEDKIEVKKLKKSKSKQKKKIFNNLKLKQIYKNNFFLTQNQQKQQNEPEISEQKLQKIIKIQRFIKRKLFKIRILKNLHAQHLLNKPKHKLKILVETGVNTDSFIIPKSTQSIIQKKSQRQINRHLKKQQESIPVNKLEEQLLKQKYELLVKARQSQQLQLQFIFEKKKGNSTNLHVINQYIICLIKYLLMYYDSELYEQIKSFYGTKVIDRMRVFNGYELEEYQPYIISQQIFNEFQENVIGINKKQIKQDRLFEHIHNKVLFDCFNQAINRRRAFYRIGGEPFIWTVNEKCFSHKQIKIQDLKNILEDAKLQILQDAKILGGIIIDQNGSRKQLMKDNNFEDFIQIPLHTHEYMVNLQDQKITKLIKKQFDQNQTDWKWIQNQCAQVMFSISEDIFEDLCNQFIKALTVLKFKRF